MGDGVKLGQVSSFLLYSISILLAILFAHLSGKYASKRSDDSYSVFKPFWALSFLCLFFPLAFRGYGVDYESYINIYTEIKMQGIGYFSHYNGMPEPLFTLLNYIVANSIDNYKWIFLFSSFIALFFFYLSFSRYVKRVDLGIVVWIFVFTYYFLMFGLVRISISVSLMAYAFKYIFLRDKVKYFIFLFIATLFHYSAIIMLPVYFFLRFTGKRANKTKFNLLSYSLVLTFFAPFIFYTIIKMFPMLFSNFHWFVRYSSYFIPVFEPKVINNFVSIIPILVLVFLLKDRIIDQSEYGLIYIKSLLLLASFAIMSTIFPIHRIAYYLYSTSWYLYASIPQLKMRKYEKKYLVLMYKFTLIIFGILCLYIGVFKSPLWGPYLFPYYFNGF